MIDLHDAILAINSNIVTIRGDVAYDKDENLVAYDMAQAQAKLAELQAQAQAEEQAQATAKASAISKLTALGLTSAEITALTGVTV